MSNFWINALGEMLGTMILVILGNGVCYSVSHSKMFANQPGKWVLIVLGWGFGVYAGVIVAGTCGAPGHLNPAVSVYAAVGAKTTSDLKVLGFIPFQFVGAMFGQVLLDLLNWKFIVATASEDINATRGAHSTGPAFENKKDKATIFNLLYEFVGTAILLVIIMSLGRYNGPQIAAHPIQVTVIVMAIGISLGSATGYAINPARDLGPRIVYQILRPIVKQKTGIELAKANWSYSWVPVIGPLLAGVIIGAFSLI